MVQVSTATVVSSSTMYHSLEMASAAAEVAAEKIANLEGMLFPGNNWKAPTNVSLTGARETKERFGNKWEVELG